MYANALVWLASATLFWIAPTQNTDGTPANVLGYRVFQQCNAAAETQVAQVSALTVPVTANAGDTCAWRVTAYDATGESAKTNAVSKTFVPGDLITTYAWSVGETPPPAAFDEGFNFRSTLGYATDPPNTQAVFGEVYPTTRNGVTFGWTSDVKSGNRDRSTTADPRLRGVNQTSSCNSTGATFRVDLNPGTYSVRLAVGDMVFSQGPLTVALKDGATTFKTFTVTTIQGQFYDATGVNRANWVADNLPLSHTFVGPLNVTISCSAPSAVIAHLRVTN